MQTSRFNVNKALLSQAGKLNVAKLANFAEIDVYVLVACPENTLVDSSEFYRPIVTPYELEVACNQAREWTGDYYTDFRELLPGEYCLLPLPRPASGLVASFWWLRYL